MVPETRSHQEAFAKIFGRLALALRLTDADAHTIAAFYRALGALPLEAVSAAADELTREAGRKFFPTTAEWYEVAKRHARRFEHEQAAERSNARCPDCDGLGFVYHSTCPATEPCGPNHCVNRAHTYVKRCGCWPTSGPCDRPAA